MLRGTLALLIRGLRFDCRRWQMHALRFLLVAIFLFFLFVSWIEYVVSIGSTPGLDFFKMLTYTNFAFITMAGMSFFTSSITEEKEEQTLGLLKMAGVNPLGILLGKIGPRLVNALLLLAIQFPFVQLAVTLGGVLHSQVQAVYITFTGYIILMSAVGLTASVVARRTRRAAMLVSAALWGPVALQFTLWLMGVSGGRSAVLTEIYLSIDWISVWSVVGRLGEILSLGFDESPVGEQFLWHIVGAGLLYLVSWMIFEPCTRNPHTPAESGAVSLGIRRRLRLRTLGPAVVLILPLMAGGFVAYPHARVMVVPLPVEQVPVYESLLAAIIVLAVGFPLVTFLVGAVRPAEPSDIGECWSDGRSLVWKDLNFVSGGAMGMVVRVTIYSFITGAMVFLIGYFSQAAGGSADEWSWSLLGGWMFGVGLVAGTLELASNVGRGLRTEVQWQTLSTLALVPRTLRAMLWSKIASGMLALIPVAVMSVIGGVLLIEPISEGVATFVSRDLSQPGGFLGLLMVPMLIILAILEIALFVILTAYFSLALRWGYLALALICTYFMNTIGGFGWGVFSVMIGLSTFGGRSSAESRLLASLIQLIPLVLAIGIGVALIVAFYNAVESKLKQLAAQS